MTAATSTREHGSRAKYVTDRCRCDDCRRAVREYERWRTRQIAYGRTAYVDAEPVRAHLLHLSAAGIGWKRAAALAGLNPSTVHRVLYGDTARGLTRSKRCRRRTATAILSVQASLAVLGDGALVPAVGTRRRLQALVAIGWSQARLAGRLGMLPSNFARTINSPDRVVARTARGVVALYEELWDQPPLEVGHRDRGSASRARNHAAARRWPPPLAWDDDTIDDPTTVPNLGEPGSRQLDLAEVEHLAEHGVYIDEIARRLGVTRAGIEQARHRARRRAS